MIKNYVDYKQLRADYLKDKKSLSRSMFPSSFVESSLGLLQKIPLVYNTDSTSKGFGLISASKTLKGLVGEVIDDVASEEYGNVVKFFMDVPASKYMQIAKDVKHGSFTPLFMYAHKLYHDVPYEAWDKDDEYMYIALGSNLAWLVDIHKNVPVSYREKVLQDTLGLRELARSFSSGKVVGLDSYNISMFRVEGMEKPCSNFWRMILQFWIANSITRVPESMILDPWDWDAVPESLDALVLSASVGLDDLGF